jgi:3-oxoacyl-[acyl-carrier protein] reductase
MNIAFDGRTAIVTGAAHGLGRAIAVAFAERGARVVACDILTGELSETAAAAGVDCIARPLDVTDRAAVQSIVREVEADAPVDILVNSAGGVLGQVGKPLDEVDENEWRTVVDVNLTGSFHTAQAVAPGMKARRGGRIVNISSGAGLGVSLTGIQAYASAKAGQIGLTRQLAHELGPFGITVNSIAPGFVRSNPTTERQWEAMGRDGQERLIRSIALKRLGSTDDIAHAVLFLASDYAGWITGQVLSVDGGK